ncbi:hypothetical protein EBT31_13410 [bacterium]|jgi:hypothetical protein|nr:hypothetical protein [bacterium]
MEDILRGLGGEDTAWDALHARILDGSFDAEVADAVREYFARYSKEVVLLAQAPIRMFERNAAEVLKITDCVAAIARHLPLESKREFGDILAHRIEEFCDVFVEVRKWCWRTRPPSEWSSVAAVVGNSLAAIGRMTAYAKDPLSADVLVTALAGDWDRKPLYARYKAEHVLWAFAHSPQDNTAAWRWVNVRGLLPALRDRTMVHVVLAAMVRCVDAGNEGMRDPEVATAVRACLRNERDVRALCLGGHVLGAIDDPVFLKLRDMAGVWASK